MTFRDFSKNLSDEIENLFATIGGSCLPEDAHRLDEGLSFQALMERVKNMDAHPPKDEPQRPL